MSRKVPCRRVRRFVLTVPEGGQRETPRAVLEHVSECDACRRMLATSQRIDLLLAAERNRLNRVETDAQTGRLRTLIEASGSRGARRRRGLRLRWARAVVLVVAAVGVSSVYFLRGRGGRGGHVPETPMATKATAAAASQHTVREMVEVVWRHKAPSLRLPYSPPEKGQESLFPRLLHQCGLQSEDTMRMLVKSKANLTRRTEI